MTYQADPLRIDLLASLEILHAGQRIAREIFRGCFEEVGDAIGAAYLVVAAIIRP